MPSRRTRETVSKGFGDTGMEQKQRNKVLRNHRELALNGGFSMVEVMIAMVILVVGVSGYSSAIISTSLSSETTREMRAATESAWSAMEEIQGTDFANSFASFNSDPADDPGVAGSAAGADFSVDSLSAVEGDADASVGEIILPAIWVEGDLQLREDADLPELGMPRDLSGDGVIDDLDHSDDYIILPVLVRMSWEGSSGPIELNFRTTLGGL
ncbi:MAG: prepilin-type N-terminal cleavage/methylation domain-containing protein [Planctomycetota bacterium]|jgi:prepilin-type N-terminal cleavage/methylation domain-containing protein